MSLRNSVPVICLSLLLAACSRTPTLPRLGLPTELPIGYRLNIQQGNVLKQEMLAQLQPGMEKKKVLFIMGTPSIQDTFHRNRWDYLYTFQRGRDAPKQRRVTLYFDGDKLARVEGDVKAADGPLVVNTRGDSTVQVPPGQKPGIFSKAVDALPFVGDKPGKPRKVKEDEDDKLLVKQPEPVVAEEPEQPAAAEEPAAVETADTAAKPVRKKKGFFRRMFTPKDDRLDDVDAVDAEDVDDDVRKNPKRDNPQQPQ